MTLHTSDTLRAAVQVGQIFLRDRITGFSDSLSSICPPSYETDGYVVGVKWSSNMLRGARENLHRDIHNPPRPWKLGDKRAILYEYRTVLVQED